MIPAEVAVDPERLALVKIPSNMLLNLLGFSNVIVPGLRFTKDHHHIKSVVKELDS